MISILLFLMAVLADGGQAQAAPPVQDESPAASQPAENVTGRAAPVMPAPSFVLQDAGGNTYQVGGLREKALLVNFWASWCGPCQLEAPDLNRLAVKYKAVLDVYSVNVTSQDTKSGAERFVRRYMPTFPVLYDLKGEVFAKYNGQAFPTNVLIDRNGNIREVILGLLPAEELERKIASLVSA
ncbi:TlpA family protein disulfide reductase [Paenibacillus tengchongensis]|uniref:TlpA family protein disulfide reductase n=1 Tax=Paenibacillus tengchongensis TaxID=2608684 RepID=UPI001FE93184|nr:TlpA disulfide reductase family protein [Paenibacillus tengchongensis]